MNDDILAYQTKFANTMFVVYDMGVIRDVTAFASSFKIPNVNVLVVKR